MNEQNRPSDAQTANTATAREAEAKARKAVADAATAEVGTLKVQAETAKLERDLPTAAERAATARKAIAEADRDAAIARNAQLKALVPDVSGVKPGTLETKEGNVPLSTFLTFGGLEGVADTIATRLLPHLPRDARVLVTGSTDLASADAAYIEVSQGLEQLSESARSLLTNLAEQKVETAALSATGLLAIAAGAIPGLLSLFTAQRTLTAGTTTIDELAAVAAVISSLNGHLFDNIVLVHDDFRLVPDGRVHEGRRRLNVERRRLIEKKAVVGAEQDLAESGLAKAQRQEKDLVKITAPPEPQAHALALEEAQKAIEAHQSVISRTTRDLSLLDAMLTAIDSFTAAIGAVPTGQRRSALTTAALYEQLHRDRHLAATSGGSVPERQPEDVDSVAFSHVLLVKPHAGGSQQLLDNKPLWFEDKFSTLVEISVSYVLISAASSHVLASGTVTRLAHAHGQIGNKPEVDFI